MHGKSKRKGMFRMASLKKLISLVLVFLLLFNVSGLNVQASDGNDLPYYMEEVAPTEDNLVGGESAYESEKGADTVVDCDDIDDIDVSDNEYDAKDTGEDIVSEDEIEVDDEYTAEEDADVDEEIIIHQVIFIINDKEKEAIEVENGDTIPGYVVPEFVDIDEVESVIWVNAEDNQEFDIEQPLAFDEVQELKLVATFEFLDEVEWFPNGHLFEMPERDVSLWSVFTQGSFSNYFAVTYRCGVGLFETQVHYVRSGTPAPAFEGELYVPGWTFIGWWDFDPAGDSVSQDITVMALWEANTDTEYTVEHWFQDVAGNYVFDDSVTQTSQGTTATLVTATPLTREGYVENRTHADRLAEGFILGDGSLVLRLFYSRNLHTVTFTHTEGGSFLEGSSPIEYSGVLTGSSWGQSGVVVPTPIPNAGFRFAGWRLLPDGEISADLNPPDFINEDLHFEAVFVELETITILVDSRTVFFADYPVLTVDDLPRVGHDVIGLPPNRYITVELAGIQTGIGTSPSTVARYEIRNQFGVDVTDQFNVTVIDGTLTIRGEVTVAARSRTALYSNFPAGLWAAHLASPGFDEVGLPEGEGFNVVATVTGSQIGIGSSPSVVSEVIIRDVRNGNDVTHLFDVTKVPGALTLRSEDVITITAASDRKVFDGTPLTNGNFTVSSLPAGVTHVTAVVEGSQTFVGGSENVVTSYILWNGERDVTAYFPAATLVEGMLEVTASEEVITITAGSARKEFDGTALTYDGFTHSALPAGVTHITANVVGSRTEVGTAANVIESFTLWNGDIDVTANFSVVRLEEGTLTIKQAEEPVDRPPATMIIRYNANHAGTDLYFIHQEMLAASYVVGDEYTVKAYTHPAKVGSDRWVLPENYPPLRFTGWNTQPDGSGTHFDAGDILRVEAAAVPTAIEATFGVFFAEATAPAPVIISLYAQWELVEEQATPAAPAARPTPRAPQTGDALAPSLLLYLALVLLSLMTIIVWFVSNKKREILETCKQSLHQREFLLTTNAMSWFSGELYTLNLVHKRWWGISTHQPSKKP